MEFLPEKERGRVLKIHALITSPYNGEQQAAASALQRLAERYRCTPDDLVAVAQREARPAPRFFSREASWTDRNPRQQPPPPRRDRHGLPDDWRGLLRRVIREETPRRHLVAFEMGFAARILAQSDDIKLSDRQAGAIERVLRKAGLWPP